MNKTCAKCKLEKPVSEFYKSTPLRKNDDGYDYYCKECRKWHMRNTSKNNKVKCTIDNCGKPHYAHGMCKSHYEKARRDRTKEQNK